RPDIAERYAACRPSPPRALVQYLAALVPTQSTAWDCGTGNGQVAVPLAEFFTHVVATDHSGDQVARARSVPNIRYCVAEAEESGLDSGTVDLITVAQAVHWFDLDKFYAEGTRVLRPGGFIAVWCYRRPRVDSRIDQIVHRLWHAAPRPEPIQRV